MCVRTLPLCIAQLLPNLDRQHCFSGCVRYVQSILLPATVAIKLGISATSGSSIPASNNNIYKYNSKYSKN